MMGFVTKRANLESREQAIKWFVIGIVILMLGVFTARIYWNSPRSTSADQFTICGTDEYARLYASSPAMPAPLMLRAAKRGPTLKLRGRLTPVIPPPSECYQIFKFTGKDTKVVIPSETTVETPTAHWLGGYFARWTGINSYKIRRSITEVASYAFHESAIESVEIPEGIIRIGQGAFSHCVNLKHVRIPESVIEIDSGAFEDCWALESVELSKRLRKIGHSAFAKCVSLRKIDLSLMTADIGQCVFAGCSKLETARIVAPLLKLNGAFSGCESLKSVTIPDGIRVFVDYEFSGCKALESFVLPKDLTILGCNSFRDCDHLKRITIGGKVETIKSGAFERCFQLEEVTITGPVKDIEFSAFEYCKSLRKVTLPDTLQNLGGRAFWGCPLLKSIHYPASLERVGKALDGVSSKLLTVDGHNKFLACNDGFLISRTTGELLQYIPCGKKDLIVPGHIKTVSRMAFAGCDELESVSFENEHLPLGKEAFYGCSNLKKLVLPTRIEQLDPYLFWYCTKLEEVVIPPTVTHIKDGVFHKCESLATLRVPDCVVEIGSHAFNGCTSLSTVSMPAGEIRIAENAFVDCPKARAVKRTLHD